MLNLSDIIEQCKQKNRKAEKVLFLRFAPKIYTLCRRYTSDEQEAQDFLQECFLHVFQHIEQYDSHKGEFSGWLYRVCTNVVLQQLRQQKTTPHMVYMEELPEIEIPIENLHQIPPETLITAIRQLPIGYRQVLNLSIFEGWKHQEIAQHLQITESASRSQLTRAKQLLKKIIINQQTRSQHGKRLA